MFGGGFNAKKLKPGALRLFQKVDDCALNYFISSIFRIISFRIKNGGG
jgi:hypothetical protein